MKFTMYHACISVMHLDKSIEFYNKALGLSVVKRIDDANGEFRLAYLGGEGFDCQLEIIWKRDQKEPYNLGDNEIHVGFRVDDYDKALELHKSMGCFHHENKTYKLYFIEDPDGYMMEILGRP